MRGRDQVSIVGILLQICPEEWANRDQLQASLPGHGYPCLDEKGAKTLAAVTFRHLGVVKADFSGLQPVGCEGEDPLAEIDLEAVAGAVVLHFEWSRLHLQACSTKATVHSIRPGVENITALCRPNYDILSKWAD